MILVDANLLLYASIASFTEHERARTWLDGKLNGSARVGLPWESLLAFLRLATNARIFSRPMSIRDAWGQVAAWQDCAVVWTPLPTDQHARVLDDLLLEPGIQGNLVPDAHLAALALEHGLELCSTDGDFARFRTLRWTNPLSV